MVINIRFKILELLDIKSLRFEIIDVGFSDLLYLQISHFVYRFII